LPWNFQVCFISDLQLVSLHICSHLSRSLRYFRQFSFMSLGSWLLTLLLLCHSMFFTGCCSTTCTLMKGECFMTSPLLPESTGESAEFVRDPGC
jgi:hypothetical protein